MNLRFSVFILLGLAAFALPWWVSLIFLLLAIGQWPWYYEGVLVVLAYELVYRLPGDALWLTLAALVLVPLVEQLKQRLYVFR